MKPWPKATQGGKPQTSNIRSHVARIKTAAQRTQRVITGVPTKHCCCQSLPIEPACPMPVSRDPLEAKKELQG